MAISLNGGYTYQCTRPELLAGAIHNLNKNALRTAAQYSYTTASQYTVNNKSYCIINSPPEPFSNNAFSSRYGFINNGTSNVSEFFENDTQQRFEFNTAVYKSPVIVYVEIGKLSELRNIATNIVANQFWGENDNLNTQDGFWAVTGGYIPTIHPNAIYIKNIIVLDNSADGSYGATKQRTVLPNGDIIIPVTVSQWQTFRYGNIYGTHNGNVELWFSLKQNAQIATGTGMNITIAAPYFAPKTTTGTYSNLPLLSMNGAGNMFNITPVQGLDANKNVVWTGAVFETENELKKLLNFFGVPYTFDYNAALTINVADLPDYDPDGVKPNPSGGGDGDGDNFSDEITFPETPFSPATLGGITTLIMTGAQLKKFTEIVWKPTTRNLIDVLQQYFNVQPLTDSVLSMYYYPFDIMAHDSGNVTIDTTLALSWSDDMFSAGIMGGNYNRLFDMGSYNLNEYYGTYLDYSPYTTVDIWLPYIGYKSLAVDDVMNKTISVKYYIEFIDGTVTAVIFADWQPINTYTGQIGINISVTGRDYAAKTRQTVDSILTTVAGVNKSVNSVMQGVGAGIIGDVGAAGAASNNVTKNLAGAGVALAGSMIQQPTTSMYGTATGENWLALPQYCHLKITRTISATPNQYENVVGYPSTYTAKIRDFGTGFIRVRAVHGAITTDNADEFNQIIQLLQSGVYIG